MSQRLNLKTLGRGLAAAGLLAALHAGAHAQETVAPLFIGGVQASSLGGYGYAGVIKPFAGARLGEGWFHRSVASVLTYRYDATVAGRATCTPARRGWNSRWAGPGAASARRWSCRPAWACATRG
jgi:hypothetical protein